jgi:ribose transport system substrate-binding protein
MAAQRFIVRRINRRDMAKGIGGVGVGAVVLGGRGLVSPARARQDGPYNITFIQGVIADEFYITMECGMRAVAESLGVNLTVTGPDAFDFTLQTPLLESVIQTAPDGIVMAPNDVEAMIAPIQAAIDADIPVLCVDTTINSDIQVADVSSDNVEGGRIAARALAEEIGGSGKVYVINVKPGISTTDQREQGFAEAIADFPDIEYLGQDYCDNDANKAAELTSAKLQAEPDIKGIFGTNLFSAQGAAAGILQAGLQGQVKVAGFDAGPQQVNDLTSEVVDLLIAQHPADIGITGLTLLVRYLESGEEPSPNKLNTGYTVVTRDNIDDPEVAKYLYISDCGQYVAPAGTPVVVPAPES